MEYLILCFMCFMCKAAACDPSPCQNGGTCVKDEQDFDCVCPEDFSGKFCHVGKCISMPT